MQIVGDRFATQVNITQHARHTLFFFFFVSGNLRQDTIRHGSYPLPQQTFNAMYVAELICFFGRSFLCFQAKYHMTKICVYFQVRRPFCLWDMPSLCRTSGVGWDTFLHEHDLHAVHTEIWNPHALYCPALYRQVVNVVATDGRQRRFLWTLERQRRPPDMGKWLVYGVVSSDVDGMLTMDG